MYILKQIIIRYNLPMSYEEVKNETSDDTGFDTEYCNTLHDNYMLSQYDRRGDSDLVYESNLYRALYGDDTFNLIRQYLKHPLIYNTENALQVEDPSLPVKYENSVILPVGPDKAEVDKLLSYGTTHDQTYRSICVTLECSNVDVHNLFDYYFLKELQKMVTSARNIYYELDNHKFVRNKSYYYLRVSDPNWFIHFNVYYPFEMLTYLVTSFKITYAGDSPQFSYIYTYF